MSARRDAAWFGLAAATLALTALADVPALFAGVAVLAFALVGRRLPHGGLLAGLAVGAVWSNVAVALGEGLSLPAMVGLVPHVLLAMVVGWRMLRGDRTIAATAPFRAALLYGAALLVSGFGAQISEPVLDSYSSFLVEGLLLWFLVVNAISDLHVLRRVLTAIVVVGGFLGAITVHQFATESFDSEYAGFGQIDDDEQELLNSQPDYTPRLSASTGEKNRFAQLLVVTLPIAVAFGRRLRGWGSVVHLTSGALMIGGIAVSGSRGAALGVLASVLLLAVLRVVSTRGMLVVAGAAVVALLLLPGYRERLWATTSIAAGSEQGEVDGSTLSRITENLAALDMYLDHPVIGVGPGGYPQHYEVYAERIGLNVRDGFRQAHNLYLGVAAELGTLGLLALVSIFALVVRDLWRARRALQATAPDLADLTSGLLVAVAAHLITGVFLHLSFERYMWTFLAIADGAARVLHHWARVHERDDGDVARPIRPALDRGT